MATFNTDYNIGDIVELIFERTNLRASVEIDAPYLENEIEVLGEGEVIGFEITKNKQKVLVLQGADISKCETKNIRLKK